MTQSPRPIRRHVGFKIPTGGTPEVRVQRADGVKVFRDWQADCFQQLQSQRVRQIVAPTGSGKSLIITALSLTDVLDGRAEKVLVVVPQSIIADGFGGSCSMALPNGRVITWLPHQLLVDSQNVIQRLHRFLTAPVTNLTRSNPWRLTVCSQAALTAHFNKYGDGTHYRDVSLVIDEAHHCQFDDQDAEAQNVLGTVVKSWLDHDYGPLTMTTATFWRTDKIDIVPPAYHAVFSRFELSWADYLERLWYIKEVEIRILVGPFGECVGHCYDESPYDNTIIYVTRDKYQDLITLQQQFIQRGTKPSEIIDLVTDTPAVRKAAKIELRRSQKAGEWAFALKGTAVDYKTYIIALMMGREGFDLPSLQRSIVIGPRDSMLSMTQMLGRLLRDCEGKSKVQFNIVLPFDNSDLANGDRIRQYTKTLLAVLVLGCNLAPPRLARRDRKTLAALLANAGKLAQRGLAQIVADVPDGPVNDPQAFIAGSLDRTDLGADVNKASAARVFRALVQSQYEKDLLAGAPDPDMVQDEFGGIRTWRLVFGHENLRELNRCIRAAPVFTWDEAAQYVLDETDENSATRV